MNRRMTYGLAITGIIILAILVWFFVLNPIMAQRAKTADAIQQEHVLQAAAQAKLSQASSTQAEGQKNAARLLELAKMIPNDPEIPSLLLQIQNLANESGIKFMSVTPGSPIQAGQFEEVPLQVEFSGTFFDLSDFVYRAEQMAAGPGRLLAIKDISLQTNEGDTGSATGTSGSTSTTLTNSTGPILKVTMTLYAFDTSSSAASSATVTTVPSTSSTVAPNGSTPSTARSGA